MQSALCKSITDLEFRSNPTYELVVFDRLPHEHQEALYDLQKDPDMFGVLLPIESNGLNPKAVNRDTALLFYTMQQPGTLPNLFRTSLTDHMVAELVLDGILEVNWDGCFVSGADAHPLLYGKKQTTTARNRIAQLSIEALQYGQALEIDYNAALSARMYFYNRIPVSPYWKSLYPSPEAIAAQLGFGPDGIHTALLDRHWQQVPQEGWVAWRNRTKRGSFSSSKSNFKLYVSPQCEYMPEVFRAVLEVFSEVQAPMFKIGKDCAGLLRPDKIVAYFTNFDELQTAAQMIATKLPGCPAHGVPFTAEIAGDGLLSWGMDPPADQHLIKWQERESWRLWVTNRLATYLLIAKSAQTNGIEPWQFALDRLQLEGVDTDTWVPKHTIWQEHAHQMEE